MLLVLVIGWAIIYADRTCLYPLLSVIGEQMSLTSAQTGALTSTYFLFYVLMQVPSGIMGDRWGLRKVLMVMFFIAAFGMMGLGLFGKTYFLLLLFTALHGFGAGGFYPAAYGTILQVVEPERRGFSSSLLGMGMAFGLLTGMVVSGPIFEAIGSFRAPFIVMSIPTFLVIILFYLKMPNVRGASQPSLQQYKKILADKDLWLINFATFAALYGFWVAVTWGPTFLSVERGFSLLQSGLYTGLVALTAVPAGIFWGRVSDRVGRKKVAMLVLPFSAISLYMLTKVTSPVGVIIVFMVYGLSANSAFAPVMVAWIGDLLNKRYPGYIGAVAGIHNSAIMSSAIVAPLISGFLRDYTGSLISAISFGVFLMLIGTIVLKFIPEGKTCQSIAAADEAETA